MYFLVLRVIRQTRRIKRRVAARVGDSGLEAAFEVAGLAVEWAKELSGIRLLVPIIALMTVPGHFTKKYSWKGSDLSISPPPAKFLIGAFGVSVWALALKGFGLEAFRNLAIFLVVAVLSPLWLTLVAGVGLLFLLYRRFREDRPGVIIRDPIAHMNVDNYLMLFSWQSWKNLDWSKYYYMLCYFSVYSAVVLAALTAIALFLLLAPVIAVLPASHSNPDISTAVSAAYSSDQFWTLFNSLIYLLVFLPGLRLFLWPYSVLFRSSQKIPSDRAFKSEFADLSDTVQELYYPSDKKKPKPKDVLIKKVRSLLQSGFALFQRQERIARRWGLIEPYLSARSEFAAELLQAVPYLDKDQDARLLQQLDDVLKGRLLTEAISQPSVSQP
jgi:hypothetical protein